MRSKLLNGKLIIGSMSGYLITVAATRQWQKMLWTRANQAGNSHKCIVQYAWAGKEQAMCFDDGVPKGMKAMLEERGINTTTLIYMTPNASNSFTISKVRSLNLYSS